MSVAQNAKNETKPQEVQTPPSMVKRPGETAVMEYVINGINGKDLYYIYVYVQKPGKALELLYVLSTDGVTSNPSREMRGRMTVSYSSSKRGGFITINSLKAEDTGIYYVLIKVNGVEYFGQGTMLTVTTALQYKTAPRKASSSKQK